jgi:hypothetical protein
MKIGFFLQRNEWSYQNTCLGRRLSAVFEINGKIAEKTQNHEQTRDLNEGKRCYID